MKRVRSDQSLSASTDSTPFLPNETSQFSPDQEVLNVGEEHSMNVGILSGIQLPQRESWRPEVKTIAQLLEEQNPPEPQPEKSGVRLKHQTWIVQGVKEGNKIEISPKSFQSVVIWDCSNVKVFIRSKVNHIEIDNCVNVWVFFESAISTCEVVHSKNCRVVCTKHIPTIQVDMTDGFIIHIPIQVDTRIVSASSPDLYVVLTHADGTAEKKRIPSSIFNDQMVTWIEHEQLFSITSEKLKSGKYVLLP